MNMNLKRIGLVLVVILAAMAVFAGGAQEAEETEAAPQAEELSGIDAVAAELGVTTEELTAALGDPSQGPPDFDEVAETLDVDAALLEELMKNVAEPENEEMEPYTVTINGVDFQVATPIFTWAELPPDVPMERYPIEEFTNEAGDTHYYEVIYLEEGNLSWYQAACLAQDAGGYLACPTSEEENDFIFSFVNDEKFFWHFPEEGDHYGISIGPFLGGYQPEGSEEPIGGWSWLSGEEWDWSNWAQNLDDGVTDKDPRDNTQPNDSGDGQPIMGYGELNIPVNTWGDYMDSIGNYGETKLPGRSYGFIIEYESDPR